MSLTLEERFERCCRLCAEEQDVTIMLFGVQAEAMLLHSKLNKYLLIEVEEDDKLPKNICISCCSKLQTVCDFIDKARKAQEELLNRSNLIEEMLSERYLVGMKNEIKEEPITSEEDSCEMEVSVDPSMVLQNGEDPMSPSNEDYYNDVTYLNGDGENVTIKLIKKGSDLEQDCSTDEVKKEEEMQTSTLKPFPCVTCKRSFTTELALKNHSWVHCNEMNDKYKCGQCEKDFYFKCDLIAHLKQHKMSGKCQFCARVFRSKKNLTAHMNIHLSSGKSFPCKVCGRSYDTLSNLKTHSITHSNERPFECHLCKKSFKRNQDLKFHVNQHTGAKPYRCPFCEKSFASSGNCYSHRSRMHPGQRVETLKSRRRSLPSKQTTQPKSIIALKSTLTSVKGIYKYQCQFCDHSFLKRDNYTYHMYQHTGEKPFHCTFCSETFVTRRGLLLHHDKDHPLRDRPLALISRNVLLK